MFPLHGTWLRACTCGRLTCDRPGKHPRTPHGLDDATVDPQQVQAWWQRWPRANIGLRTGRPLEGLPLTPTVESGMGSHLYFRTEQPVGNRVALVPGVDLRGERGYVVAPPSRHVTGATYRWRVTLDVPLAKLPPWVLEKMAQPREHALREHPDNHQGQTPAPRPQVGQGERGAMSATSGALGSSTDHATGDRDAGPSSLSAAIAILWLSGCSRSVLAHSPA